MPALDLQFHSQHANGTMGLGHTGTYSRSPRGLFGEIVGLAQNATTHFRHMQAREHAGRPSCLIGQLTRPRLARFNDLVSRFDTISPPTTRRLNRAGLRSRRWLASEVLGPGWEQAVTLVDFDPGATAITLLAYEHSDRLVIVREGRGTLHTAEATLDEVAKKGFGRLGAHELSAGTALMLSRGFIHGIAGHSEQSLELLVCHLPYIDPDDEHYATVAKWLRMASLRDILDVFRDQDMLTALFLVNDGVRSTAELCRLMHQERRTVESLGDQLESIRMVIRDAVSGWRLHPTVSMCEKDGKIEIAREERGYRVSQRFRRLMR